MGFRFNKNIRIGKNFRINLSKSGVGYSYGIKGYRITKTSKGNIRHTASIPGTGISYVEEHKNKQNIPNNSNSPKRNNTKIILLCILCFLFFPVIPAIVATALLRKSNLKKSSKIVFITLSWFLNLFLIGLVAPASPNSNEAIPVIDSNEDSLNDTEIKTELSSKTTNEPSSEILSIKTNSQNPISVETKITTETSSPITQTISKETVPTTFEIISEKSTQITTQVSKEITTNNVEIKTLYVGNKDNQKLHRGSCRYVDKMLPENIVQFDSRDKAISSGYTDLCGVCKP